MLRPKNETSWLARGLDMLFKRPEVIHLPHDDNSTTIPDILHIPGETDVERVMGRGATLNFLPNPDSSLHGSRSSNAPMSQDDIEIYPNSESSGSSSSAASGSALQGEAAWTILGKRSLDQETTELESEDSDGNGGQTKKRKRKRRKFDEKDPGWNRGGDVRRGGGAGGAGGTGGRGGRFTQGSRRRGRGANEAQGENQSGDTERGRGSSVSYAQHQMSSEMDLMAQYDRTEFQLGPYHPSDTINKYLLQRFPDSKIAITHDSVWCSVMREVIISSHHFHEGSFSCS
ncbi:hypothetical protein K435DRAFT_220629 [Dendrothele bispora CBS 962.96]|uniref:Uncharacterized protein n=1 Tax=Dendrothele bispora (strain CBS 962.96) TaxID=1314807 RepID=A0A4S8MMC0_DENBC|nr:hypothetical protein K435DRAFT_220629 [Dendrothele bispora CBS 962.96]